MKHTTLLEPAGSGLNSDVGPLKGSQGDEAEKIDGFIFVSYKRAVVGGIE